MRSAFKAVRSGGRIAVAGDLGGARGRSERRTRIRAISMRVMGARMAAFLAIRSAATVASGNGRQDDLFQLGSVWTRI